MRLDLILNKNSQNQVAHLSNFIEITQNPLDLFKKKIHHSSKTTQNLINPLTNLYQITKEKALTFFISEKIQQPFFQEY